MIAKFSFLFADVSLPGAEQLTSPARGVSHMQPALVGVAFIAIAVVAFLGIDFYRQKRTERKEREKLERFRSKRQREMAETAANRRVA
jgi:hypothetical protein